MMSHILLLRIVRSCCRGSQGAPASIPEGEGPLPSSWAGGDPGLGGPDPLWCHQVLPDPLSPPCHQCQREPDEKAQWLLIDFRDVVCSEVGWGGRWVPDPQPTGTAGTPCLGSPPCLPLQDSWNHKEYMARVWMGHLLAHPAVKLILSVLIVIKEVVITS